MASLSTVGRSVGVHLQQGFCPAGRSLQAQMGRQAARRMQHAHFLHAARRTSPTPQPTTSLELRLMPSQHILLPLHVVIAPPLTHSFPLAAGRSRAHPPPAGELTERGRTDGGAGNAKQRTLLLCSDKQLLQASYGRRTLAEKCFSKERERREHYRIRN